MLLKFCLILIIKNFIYFKRYLVLTIKNKSKNDKYIKEYINFNKKYFKSKIFENEHYIITDILNKPRSLLPNSVFINFLQKKYNLKAATFSRFKRSTNDELYNSINVKSHFKIELKISDLFTLFKYYKKFLKKIQTKEDFYKFKIEGMSIGQDIYETILKNGNPTISLKNFKTNYYILLGLINFIYLKKLIIAKKIKFCLLSHDCYIDCGILSKLAIKYKVPLLFANDREINFSDKEHDVHLRFKKYPLYFRYLVKNKIKSREIARKTLNKRLSGKVGIKMPYQIKSAFHNKISKKNVLKKTNNIKIIILTHCFFDNPHTYCKMEYPDFYEWIKFLKKHSLQKKNIDWYIKPHRDYLPGTIEAIYEIIRGSQIKVIDPNISHYQLKKEKIDYAITCHGSVGHELPLIGINVINSSFNPHIAYNFNYHLENKSKLQRFLNELNKGNQTSKLKFSKKEIYEFFYVHKYLISKDDFFFDSFEKFSNFVNHNLLSTKGFKYFIINHKKIINKYQKHIEYSLKQKIKYSIERDIPKKFQEKVKFNFDNV